MDVKEISFLKRMAIRCLCKEGNRTMKKYKRALTAAIGCAAIFLASAGLTNAFLQKPMNELNNVITPGSIDVLLTEPLWKREDASNLLPGQTVSKNPTVTNTGDNDSWVFLRVDVPIKNIRLVDPETKMKTEKVDTELLSFEADTTWELVEKTMDTNAAHYVYGFNKILKSGASTSALFSHVTIVNYLEGEIDPEEILTMPIEAVSIQSNVESADDGLRAIYQEYLSQEAADGKE